MKVKWTFLRCFESANRFKHLDGRRSSDPGAYSAACKHGWIKKCKAHMSKKTYFRLSQFDSLELCMAVSIRFESVTAWRTASFISYRMAWLRGWLPQCTAHMLVYQHKQRHTLKSVCESANKHKTFRSWHKHDLNSYRAAHHNGWFEKATAHMELGSVRDELVALNFVAYRVNLSDGHFYFGVTRNPKLRAWYHRNHGASAVFQHLKRHPAEYKFVIIQDKLNGLEAFNLEKMLIAEHCGNSMMLNKNAGGQLGPNISVLEVKKHLQVVV